MEQSWHLVGEKITAPIFKRYAEALHAMYLEPPTVVAYPELRTMTTDLAELVKRLKLKQVQDKVADFRQCPIIRECIEAACSDPATAFVRKHCEAELLTRNVAFVCKHEARISAGSLVRAKIKHCVQTVMILEPTVWTGDGGVELAYKVLNLSIDGDVHLNSCRA